MPQTAPKPRSNAGRPYDPTRRMKAVRDPRERGIRLRIPGEVLENALGDAALTDQPVYYKVWPGRRGGDRTVMVRFYTEAS